MTNETLPLSTMLTRLDKQTTFKDKVLLLRLYAETVEIDDTYSKQDLATLFQRFRELYSANMPSPPEPPKRGKLAKAIENTSLGEWFAIGVGAWKLVEQWTKFLGIFEEEKKPKGKGIKPRKEAAPKPATGSNVLPLNLGQRRSTKRKLVTDTGKLPQAAAAHRPAPPGAEADKPHPRYRRVASAKKIKHPKK